MEGAKEAFRWIDNLSSPLDQADARLGVAEGLLELTHQLAKSQK